MYLQERNGIYVYSVKRWSYGNPEIVAEFFCDINQLFRYFSEWRLKYLLTDWDGIFRKAPDRIEFEYYGAYDICFKAVYDDKGKWYSPDLLLGMYRKWRAEFSNVDYYREKHERKRRGRKPKAIGSLVCIPIGRKLRQAFHDPEVLELGISFDIGKEKSARMLQLPYEDHYYHRTEKSWKTQSKRKRQWK